jgi:hypothetical protein
MFIILKFARKILQADKQNGLSFHFIEHLLAAQVDQQLDDEVKQMPVLADDWALLEGLEDGLVGFEVAACIKFEGFVRVFDLQVEGEDELITSEHNLDQIQDMLLVEQMLGIVPQLANQFLLSL